MVIRSRLWEPAAQTERSSFSTYGQLGMTDQSEAWTWVGY